MIATNPIDSATNSQNDPKSDVNDSFLAALRPALCLVPTPLDFGIDPLWPIEQTLPMSTLREAAAIEHWVCENAKSLRAFLKRVDAVVSLVKPLQSLNIQELPRAVHKKGDHAGAGLGLSSGEAAAFLRPVAQGQSVGLASEAGMPCVADPGSSLVRAAHDAGVLVRCLAGPSSVLTALASSGLNGQNFAFVGYLPQDGAQRDKRINQLEQFALREAQTQLLIETPYRNQAVWDALLRCLKPNTRLVAAQGLATPHEWVASRSVQGWRAGGGMKLAALPTVFGFGL